MELLTVLEQIDEEAKVLETTNRKGFKAWMPKRVVFTPDAMDEPYGRQIFERAHELNLNIELLKKQPHNRFTRCH
jgi:spore photoproduct lyase